MAIEIVRVGQGGKASLIFDMFRLRARVFKDQLGWNVSVDADGLETDEFDSPEALYLLSITNDRVVGTWRLLPSTGPTMIHDIWPEFTKTLPFPRDRGVIEVSRFAVSPICENRNEVQAASAKVIAEMFCGLTEYCIDQGVNQVFTLYDDRIKRLLERINCIPAAVSETLDIGGSPARIGVFATDGVMLARLRQATGISHSVLPLEFCSLDLTTDAEPSAV